MFGSWQRSVGWFLLFVLLSILSVFVDTYWYQPVPQLPPSKQQLPIQGHVALRVPSIIANLHRNTTRQFLQSVDLRRAEVRLATQAERENTAKPLMDKVLVVPKRFRGV